MAFANTEGGYLVFGICNGSFDLVGLDSNVVSTLTNTNLIRQKVNRFVEPGINKIRSKVREFDGKQVVILFIPPSLGCTHVVSNEGKFKYPTGIEKTLLYSGTLYVRKSAGNQLVSSRDLDDIFNRRLEHFKESLLNKISKVIDAPTESDVLIVSGNDASETKKMIISNNPDAIPVRGMSFSISPTTPEEAIASWIALSKGSLRASPDNQTLWEWYQQRKILNISQEQKIEIARFSICKGLPIFYWIQYSKDDEIKKMLLETASQRLSVTHIDYPIAISCFLGKSFHSSVLSHLNRSGNKIDVKSHKYPKEGVHTLIGPSFIEGSRKLFKGSEKDFKSNLEAELDAIVEELVNDDNVSDYIKTRRVISYDCYLYSQQDQYKKEKVKAIDVFPNNLQVMAASNIVQANSLDS